MIAPLTPGEQALIVARWGESRDRDENAYTTDGLRTVAAAAFRDFPRLLDALAAALGDAAEGRRLLNAWMIAPNEDDEAWDRLMVWEDKE